VVPSGCLWFPRHQGVGAATLVASVSRVPRLGTSTFCFILMACMYHDYDIFSISTSSALVLIAPYKGLQGCLRPAACLTLSHAKIEHLTIFSVVVPLEQE